MRPFKNHIEKDLVILLKKEDMRAFDELYYRYLPRAKAFARTFLKDTIQCEEVLQEVFIKIWEKRNNLDPQKSFQAYLFQSVKHQIFNLFRKKVHEQSLDNCVSLKHYATNELDEQMDFQELNQKTNMCIQSLPKIQRKIVKYSRLQGFSNTEIAEKLNISKRTVEHHIYLATKTLRKKILTQEAM